MATSMDTPSDDTSSDLTPSDRWTDPDSDLCDHVQVVLYQLVEIDTKKAKLSTIGGGEVEVIFDPGINLGRVTCGDLCRWAHRNRGFPGRAHELRLLSGDVTGDKTELVISIGMEPPTMWFLEGTIPPIFTGEEDKIRQAKVRWWRSSLW